MTDRLVEDPDGLAVLAAQVAAQIGIPVEHVEKDFWVIEILRGVVEAASAPRVPVIFKGGTSLSKAHSIIQRFPKTWTCSCCCPLTARRVAVIGL